MTLVRPAAIILLVVLHAAWAGAQIAPDFDAAAWTPLCAATEPETPVFPRGANLVGDATYPAAYLAVDGSFVYLRYRVDGDPTGAGGFIDASWSALVQAPGRSGFQYQYLLTLNGNGRNHDQIEIWKNTSATDIVFDPLFVDDAEEVAVGHAHNEGPVFARSRQTVQAGEDPPSRFRGNADYFVDVAFPIADLVTAGAIADASQVPELLFYPVTASPRHPAAHDLDHLACASFLPSTTLTLDKSVAPASVRPITTPVTYTFAVHNTGQSVATGLTVRDAALPASFASIVVTASDPGAVVVSANPLEVRVDRLAAGATVTVSVNAQVTAACGDPDIVGEGSVTSISAPGASASATLQVDDTPQPEVCDGVDNDCDHAIDEGGDTLCDDPDPCTGIESCGGSAGCQPGTPPTCGDGDPCTSDSCTPGVGCRNDPIPGCVGCDDATQCGDGNGCTTDTCQDGVCHNDVVPGCRRCSGVAECSDGNGCTDDVCNANGVCENPSLPNCTPCTDGTQCNDGNTCTTDQCNAEGRCDAVTIPSCRACHIDAECEDGDPCTADTCPAGACTRIPIAGCGGCVPSPEQCANGADEDCDQLVDCADPDCAGVGSCPAAPEVCDNCRDDDGDGMIDWEDSDCCEQPRSLVLDRLLLTPGTTRVRGDHFRVEAEYAPATPALFDPLRRDTSIVLSDASGPLVCTTMAAQHWHRGRGFSFRFIDKRGSVAGGLQLGRFNINRRGQLMFSARSKSISLRAVEGGAVRVTIRVGNECSRSTATLRPKKSGLVFP